MQPLAARLALQAQLLQSRDLALALNSRRMAGGEVRDQLRDAFAQLQCEVGGRRAHQLAHVLHRHFVIWLHADRVLGLAHFFGKGSEVAGEVAVRVAPALEDVAALVVSVVMLPLELALVEVDEDELLGAISSIPSSSACVLALIALSSPINQP